jgi:hypothetical protein
LILAVGLTATLNLANKIDCCTDRDVGFATCEAFDRPESRADCWRFVSNLLSHQRNEIR